MEPVLAAEVRSPQHRFIKQKPVRTLLNDQFLAILKAKKEVATVPLLDC